MQQPGPLDLTLPSDREVMITRRFAAPPHLVYRAWTEPELLRRWLIGPPGWTMTTCDIDLRVGGAYRYAWRNVDGSEMGMGGLFQVIVPSEQLVATEAFDESWYPGEALDTTNFVGSGSDTVVTLTVLYESKEARDTALSFDMMAGMEAGYARIDAFLPELLAARGS